MPLKEISHTKQNSQEVDLNLGKIARSSYYWAIFANRMWLIFFSSKIFPATIINVGNTIILSTSNS